jgi:Trypsin-co-occurring domain 2
MTRDDNDPVGVGLAEAIDQVRTELEQAIKDGERSAVAFRAGPVELEFEVAFAKTGGVEGGLQLSVLSFGAKGERSSTATHRVKVALTPVDRQGRDKLIGDVGKRDTGTK